MARKKNKKKTEKDVSKFELIQALQELDYSERDIRKVLSAIDASESRTHLPTKKTEEKPEETKEKTEEKKEPQVGDLSTVENIKPWEKTFAQNQNEKQKLDSFIQEAGKKPRELKRISRRKNRSELRRKRKGDFTQAVNEESHLIWKLIFISILFVLLVVGSALVLAFVYSP